MPSASSSAGVTVAHQTVRDRALAADVMEQVCKTAKMAESVHFFICSSSAQVKFWQLLYQLELKKTLLDRYGSPIESRLCPSSGRLHP